MSKAKELTGEAKANAEKEIDKVSKRHEAMDETMNEVEDSMEEKFHGPQKLADRRIRGRDSQKPSEGRRGIQVMRSGDRGRAMERDR
jgi:hypothetical protein